MQLKAFITTLLVSFVLTAAPALKGEECQKLYILSSLGDDMTVVDVVTHQIIKTLKVGREPHGIAAPKSQDFLYVSTEGDRGLTVIDPAKDEIVAQYHIFGERPNEIDITSDGRFLYVPALVAGVVEVFDTRQKRIVARVPTDGFPHNVVVSPDDRLMYLSPYDRGKTSAEQAKAQGLPTTLNKKIYIVDTSTHSIVGTIPTGNTPRPIALSGDGKRLYVNTDDFMGFLVLDTVARKVLYEVPYELTESEKAEPSRSHGIGITPDQKEVWSTDTHHRLVHVFDVTVDPPRQIARVDTGGTPYWLTFSPDSRTVYVANTSDDSVSVIDVAAKKVRTKIFVGKGKAPKRMLVLTVPEE